MQDSYEKEVTACKLKVPILGKSQDWKYKHIWANSRELTVAGHRYEYGRVYEISKSAVIWGLPYTLSLGKRIRLRCSTSKSLLFFQGLQQPTARSAHAIVYVLGFKISLCNCLLPARSWGWLWLCFWNTLVLLTKWQATNCMCGRQMVSVKSKRISVQFSRIKRMIAFSLFLKFLNSKHGERKLVYRAVDCYTLFYPNGHFQAGKLIIVFFFIIYLLIQFGLVWFVVEDINTLLS